MVKYYKFYSEIPEARKKPLVSHNKFLKIVDEFLKERGVRSLTKNEKKKLKKVL